MKLCTVLPLALAVTNVSAKICTKFNVPVTVVSTVSTFYPNITSNYDVVDFVNSIAKRNPTSLFPPVKNATNSYTVGATFCTPRILNGNEKTVLLATHGLGFDRSYWDSGYMPAEYSFVDFAINRGYSVFFYDRLGTGESSKVSGLSEAQATTQLAILVELTNFVRSAQFAGTVGTPPKIVHVGHSYGSLIVNSLLATNPGISDGALLTGVGYVGTTIGTFLEALALRIANQLDPHRWSDRDAGYLIPNDKYANVAAFLALGTYDEGMVEYIETVKQPLAAIEFASRRLLQLNTTYTGPVMIITGERDIDFCGADCNGLIDSPATKANFLDSKNFQAVIHPGAGHAINFSHNATGAYGAMLDYLKSNGL